MNIIEKILAKASGKEEAKPNEIVEAKVDTAMINDITGPLSIKAFKEIGIGKVWNKQKIVLILDHQTPANTIKAAKLHKIMREFAEEQKIPHLYDIGFGGICHQVMIENSHVKPGKLIVGADSHTCTYGALGAFATGIGSTDMAAVLATGKIWLKVPPTIKINITGKLEKLVTPKDLILYIIKHIKSDGAIYKAIEFTGPTINEINISGRQTICNMAIEMGAKTGIINPDEKTIKYLQKHIHKPINPPISDPNSKYEREVNLKVDKLKPQIACPHSVDNVKEVEKVEGIKIDQAFIGSCTNGRLEDLKLAAKILRKRKVKKRVRLIITPASQKVYLKALKQGLLEIFIKAGAIICNPNCGACFGGHMGLLAPGEVCISTSNRNFMGRMGSPEAKIYLASPATVAASAIKGEIIDPRKMERQQ